MLSALILGTQLFCAQPCVALGVEETRRPTARQETVLVIAKREWKRKATIFWESIPNQPECAPSGGIEAEQHPPGQKPSGYG